MTAPLWFIFGAVVGAFIGMVVMALLAANGRHPEVLEE